MDEKTRALVRAIWEDARKSWPVALPDMETEAERILAGGKFLGGPYMMLADALTRAGVLPIRP